MSGTSTCVIASRKQGKNPPECHISITVDQKPEQIPVLPFLSHFRQNECQFFPPEAKSQMLVGVDWGMFFIKNIFKGQDCLSKEI